MGTLFDTLSSGLIVISNGLSVMNSLVPLPVTVFAILGLGGTYLIARAEEEELKRDAKQVEVVRH